MSEDLTCPTCGSDRVPTHIKVALAEVAEMPPAGREALMRALETLYLYGADTTEDSPWKKTTYGIVGHLSPNTEIALRELDADAVWRFFRARFRSI